MMHIFLFTWRLHWRDKTLFLIQLVELIVCRWAHANSKILKLFYLTPLLLQYQMLPWSLILNMEIKGRETAARISRAHPPIDFFKIFGLPNCIDGEQKHCLLPIFRGHDNNHSARFHVLIFFSRMREFNIRHEDHMMLMFCPFSTGGCITLVLWGSSW